MDELRDPAQAQPHDPGATPAFRGVITDWGGVMTNPIRETVQAWLDSEGIDRDTYAAVMKLWVVTAYDPAADGNPVHALERGEITNDEFDACIGDMKATLDARHVPATDQEALLAVLEQTREFLVRQVELLVLCIPCDLHDKHDVLPSPFQ